MIDIWKSQPEETNVAKRLGEDELYRVLAARPRRRILAFLLEESSGTVEELTTMLSGWRAGQSSTMITPEEHERIRIELYHKHLPYLDQGGFIEFDPAANTARLTSLEADIQQLIGQSIEAEAQLDL